MFRSVPTRREIENSKTTVKKFKKLKPTLTVIENSKKVAKKLKNTLIASFQAKIGWKRLRERENKSYHSVSFLPDPQ